VEPECLLFAIINILQITFSICIYFENKLLGYLDTGFVYVKFSEISSRFAPFSLYNSCLSSSILYRICRCDYDLYPYQTSHACLCGP
jgi:hypothetical protein